MAELPANPQLVELHIQWRELNERLREQERQLALDLALYARGNGPRPDSTIRTVTKMRSECAERFQRLIDATKSLG